MTDQDTEAAVLARRNLIRGGAVLAGAAGLTAVGAALAPKASATDGSAILQGQTNSGAGAATTTGITITNAASTTAPLTLTHTNTNAPHLRLGPRDAFGDSETLPDLRAGEVLNTDLGPYIGLSDGATPETVVTGFLATNFDLDAKAEALAITPQRVLDTRTEAGQLSIRVRSTGALNSGRLVAGTYIDVVVSPDRADGVVDAAFFNLVSLAAVGRGGLTAYPPTTGNTVPSTSTLNFPGTTTIGNFAFVGVRYVNAEYRVRIYTTQTTHVVLDVTGYALRGASAEPQTVTSSSAQRRRAPFASRRILRTKKR